MEPAAHVLRMWEGDGAQEEKENEGGKEDESEKVKKTRFLVKVLFAPGFFQEVRPTHFFQALKEPFPSPPAGPPLGGRWSRRPSWAT